MLPRNAGLSDPCCLATLVAGWKGKQRPAFISRLFFYRLFAVINILPAWAAYSFLIKANTLHYSLHICDESTCIRHKVAPRVARAAARLLLFRAAFTYRLR